MLQLLVSWHKLFVCVIGVFIRFQLISTTSKSNKFIHNIINPKQVTFFLKNSINQ